MANSSLTLSSIDFDTLKANFKEFLKTQSVFKDYDFDGSNINVLLDVMSYNSYLNAFYLNMVASEMFLDSAQKYDSIVSHAKELNYVPRSTHSSAAEIEMVISTTGIMPHRPSSIIAQRRLLPGTSSFRQSFAVSRSSRRTPSRDQMANWWILDLGTLPVQGLPAGSFRTPRSAA